MNPAHTPGPWFVSDGMAVMSSSTNAIALPCDVEGAHVNNARVLSTHVDFRELRANASLIAAAPELLAALEAILAESDHDGYGARTDAQIPRLRAALRLASTAIAKAKGGAT